MVLCRGRRALEVTLRCAPILILAVAAAATSAAAQTASAKRGAELYTAACAACHGADGRGTPPTLLGFETPVPDFTDCSFSTVEPDADWMAVSHDGGPARAFDRRMPAFGDAMTDDELQRVLDHIRGFCGNPAWPRGELNMPRSLVTEKAFPENEAVWTTTVSATGPGEVGNELLYEQRLGARSQYEVVIPLVVQEGESGGWNRGLGDVAFALKHVLAHNLERGHILSAAGELIFPTGKESVGLGSGVTVFEPFVAFGQLLPADGFVQAQAGLELPFDTDRAGREAFWRVVIGKTFTEGRFGRSWSPMVEWLAARDLEDGTTVQWDVVPQMQVTLNKRQHIMINVGVRVPVNQRAGRSTQVITYFLGLVRRRPVGRVAMSMRIHMRTPILLPGVVALWMGVLFFSLPEAATPQVAGPAVELPAGHPDTMFVTSHECGACHNGLITPAGEDVSIGVSWRASMMANSSRDPYWQAGVRREIMDHPAAAEEIEDECAICHMPMSRTKARAANRHGQIFAHLPIGARTTEDDRLAADGVSCSVCHQIGPERLGTRESFNGGFVMAQPTAEGQRRMFGPYEVDLGRQTIMRSATGMTPAEATHLRESEVCATCHTLYTQALGPKGEVLAELPEQVPYLEWQHSAFRQEQSCQSCHMPNIAQPTRIASVLGEERMDVGLHTFLGGNFFMLRMLNRYRTELGVEALPQELEMAAGATIAQLQRQTASMTVAPADLADGQIAFDVTVRNLTGHKLPTAYPSRRAWLHVTIRDREAQVLFESGAVEPSGLIRGNDNDLDAARFEPHHTEIRSEDQVQVYESVMHDVDGSVTTGLLRGVRYIKDNRLLPRGFDKATAMPDIAVQGGAQQDPDFIAESDRVRYVVDTGTRSGPFQVSAELRYQPISYRWAQNLRAYDAMETRRFVNWYDEMASGSSQVLASVTTSIR